MLQQLAKDGVQLDFLLLDHVKHLYLPDLQLAIKLGLLKKGSVVVADNILFPVSGCRFPQRFPHSHRVPILRFFLSSHSQGSPEYRSWMLANSAFDTTVHKTTAEYTPWMPDEVLVSVYQGDASSPKRSSRSPTTKRK